MFVLGVTNWYQSEGVAGAPITDDLVFGVYSFAFLLEVRNKLGGMFFLSGILNLLERGLRWLDIGESVDRNSLLKGKRGIPLGTMLLFSPKIISPYDSHGNLVDGDGWWEAESEKEVVDTDESQYYTVIPSAKMCEYGPEYDEHPAVKTWRL